MFVCTCVKHAPLHFPLQPFFPANIPRTWPAVGSLRHTTGQQEEAEGQRNVQQETRTRDAAGLLTVSRSVFYPPSQVRCTPKELVGTVLLREKPQGLSRCSLERGMVLSVLSLLRNTGINTSFTASQEHTLYHLWAHKVPSKETIFGLSCRAKTFKMFPVLHWGKKHKIPLCFFRLKKKKVGRKRG